MTFIKSSSRDFFVNKELTRPSTDRKMIQSLHTSQAETCQEKKSPWNGVICFKMTVLLISQLIFLPVYFLSCVFLNCFAFHIWSVLSSSCCPFVERSEVSQLWLRNNKTTLNRRIKVCNKVTYFTINAYFTPAADAFMKPLWQHFYLIFKHSLSFYLQAESWATHLFAQLILSLPSMPL